MSKILSIIAVIVILIAAVTIVTRNEVAEHGKGETIKIGVSEPLSGAAAYYGESSKKGIELAAEYLKEKYPNTVFEIYHEDNQFSPKVGVDTYNSLKARYAIDAIITQTSPVAIAVQPLAAKDNIPQMAISASADKYATADDLSFRTTAGTELEIKPTTEYIKNNYKNIALLYMNNEIGVSISTSLRTTLASSSDVKIAVDEGFAIDATDFRTMIAKLKAEKVEAVYVAGLATHTGTILKQMTEMKTPLQILSFRTAEDPTLLKNAGVLAEGVIFTSAFDPLQDNDEVQSFVDRFQKKYNEIPDGYAAEAYEGLRFLGESYAKCGKDNDCIKENLFAIKDAPSVFGEVSFDRMGNITYDFFLKTVKDGKFVRLEN